MLPRRAARTFDQSEGGRLQRAIAEALGVVAEFMPEARAGAATRVCPRATSDGNGRSLLEISQLR